MKTNWNSPRELRAERAQALDDAQAIVKRADASGKLTGMQKIEFDQLMNRADELGQRIKYLESPQRVSALVGSLEHAGMRGILDSRQAPAWQRTLDDSETRALAHYFRSGDVGALSELRASNDTVMEIGTAADGGNAVPTGHFQGIVARRDEMLLARKLNVREIGGKGTTVNVPVDNEDDGEFVQTAEQDDAHAQNYDRDAPALDKAAMTLVKYTKKVELTEELLDDEDSGLVNFVTDFVARGMAKTHNNLLLTEVAANGTSLKTFASATAIAAGEPEDIVYQDSLNAYLDDGRSMAWVMRPSTYGDITSLTSNARLYGGELPSGPNRSLIGYPVQFSNKAAAIGASAKSTYFGNWWYVGLREQPIFRFLRDPYTVDGMVILKYSFRCVYKVLQAEAVGYGEHPSA